MKGVLRFNLPVQASLYHGAIPKLQPEHQELLFFFRSGCLQPLRKPFIKAKDAADEPKILSTRLGSLTRCIPCTAFNITGQYRNKMSIHLEYFLTGAPCGKQGSCPCLCLQLSQSLAERSGYKKGKRSQLVCCQLLFGTRQE